jgi:hypothetical protein
MQFEPVLKKENRGVVRGLNQVSIAELLMVRGRVRNAGCIVSDTVALFAHLDCD